MPPGQRSARAIECRCRQDIGYRVITANRVPDHATIARFVCRHEALGERLLQRRSTATALATVSTLATLSLVLPTFTTSRTGPEFSAAQLAFAAVASLALRLSPVGGCIS